jgi:hypothetical protein
MGAQAHAHRSGVGLASRPCDATLEFQCLSTWLSSLPQEVNQQRLGLIELGVRSELCLTLRDESGLEIPADRRGTVESWCPGSIDPGQCLTDLSQSLTLVRSQA